MKKFFSIAGLFLLFPFFLAGQDCRYVPEAKGTLIRNTYYSLDFNGEHKQPNWVYYMLTHTHINGSTPRSSTFKDCKHGEVRSATNKDYKGSGYDKGHLCPAADMKLCKQAMVETFHMWNMSPQEPSFNRGRWSDLEAQVRKYVTCETDTLFVVTGPVFICNKGCIGEGEVTIPGFFYKVAYCPRRGGIGFLMPNDKVKSDTHSWQVSIDLIEMLTGIDFFPQLPQKLQDEIESQVTRWDAPNPKELAALGDPD